MAVYREDDLKADEDGRKANEDMVYHEDMKMPVWIMKMAGWMVGCMAGRWQYDAWYGSMMVCWQYEDGSVDDEDGIKS